MSIEWVSSQIAEILESNEKNSALLQKKIVVSPFGAIFIARSSWLGRFWTFLWSLSRIIDWSGVLEIRAFSRALIKIAGVWKENIAVLSFHSNIFKTLMESSIKGDLYLLQDEKALTHRVLRLAQIYLFPAFRNYGSYPFIENWRHINELLGVPENSEASPSFLEEGFLSWIATLSGESFPFMSTFKKIFFQEVLTTKEKNQFKNWIEILQEQEAFIPIADFLIALKRLAFHLQALPQLPDFLIRLNGALKKEGCFLFDKIDPYHAARVSSSIERLKLVSILGKEPKSILKKGTPPSIGSKDRMEGSNLFCKDNLIYLSSSEDYQLVWSPKNEVALSLIQSERSSGGWKNYILPLEILEDGLYAKISKWDAFSKSNLPSLTRLLKSLISKCLWSPFLVKDLFVSVSTEIKILTPITLEDEPLVYEKAISFIASFQDPELFNEMAQRLDLYKHPIQIYYKDTLSFRVHPEKAYHNKLVQSLKLAPSISDILEKNSRKIRFMMEQARLRLLPCLDEKKLQSDQKDSFILIDRIRRYFPILSSELPLLEDAGAINTFLKFISSKKSLETC